MLGTVLQVAFGGAVGASARYLLGIAILRHVGHTAFPVAVLTANVLGSFLMGLFVVAAAKKGLTLFSPLVATGLLGGFTTFSAFSLEAVTLYERGAFLSATAYVGGSVVLSILGLMTGLALGRGIWA
ncbi:MAG: fluoride efflux transporter CrcB [Pseudomonadota bacterium]